MKTNLLLLLMIILTSCGKDGVFPSKETKIIGTWTLQSISYPKDVQYLSNEFFEFRDNNTFTETFIDILSNDTTYTGNWKIKRSELTLTYDDGKISVKEIKKISTEKLIFTNDEQTITYIKN